MSIVYTTIEKNEVTLGVAALADRVAVSLTLLTDTHNIVNTIRLSIHAEGGNRHEVADAVQHDATTFYSVTDMRKALADKDALVRRIIERLC